MKILNILFFILVVNVCNAQLIEGIVRDSINNKEIAYVNVVLKNGKGTYTDEFGTFQLNLKNALTDTIKISAIGYKSRLLPVTNFTKGTIFNIFLQPKTELLDEVVISSKSKTYGKKEVLGEKRDGNIGVTSLIGIEKAIFIANPKSKIGKVNGVYINLKKRKSAEYIATFNVKFYHYDSINNSPGKLLYHKNLFVLPKNKKYRLWIAVKDLNIPFPKKGICVGVEMVNTHGKVKKYTSFGPMFRYTFAETKVLKTWSNYHNQGWKDGYVKHKRFKHFKQGVSNPMIGVEVAYVLD